MNTMKIQLTKESEYFINELEGLGNLQKEYFTIYKEILNNKNHFVNGDIGFNYKCNKCSMSLYDICFVNFKLTCEEIMIKSIIE